MRSSINYSDLNQRKRFDYLVSFLHTEKPKIKLPNRDATEKLKEKIHRLRQKKNENKK